MSRPRHVLLRPYRPADARATLDVFRRAVRLTAARDYSPEQVAAWAGDDIDLGRWAAARESARTCVAAWDDGVVGFTDVDDRGYIDMMFVDPAHGGQGIAGDLLEWAVGAARASGAAELSTHASLTARPFFEARGFVAVREQRPVRRGVELVNVVMRRRLDAA